MEKKELNNSLEQFTKTLTFYASFLVFFYFIISTFVNSEVREELLLIYLFLINILFATTIFYLDKSRFINSKFIFGAYNLYLFLVKFKLVYLAVLIIYILFTLYILLMN